MTGLYSRFCDDQSSGAGWRVGSGSFGDSSKYTALSFALPNKTNFPPQHNYNFSFKPITLIALMQCVCALLNFRFQEDVCFYFSIVVWWSKICGGRRQLGYFMARKFLEVEHFEVRLNSACRLGGQARAFHKRINIKASLTYASY